MSLRYLIQDKLSDAQIEAINNAVLFKGQLIAAMTASGNADQSLTTTPVEINFDTTDHSAGFITRSGNQFIIGHEGIFMFNLQPQVTELTPSNITTLWAVKNGTEVPRTGIRNSSTGVNDTHVEPLCISLQLAVDDVITFNAVTTSLLGSRLDNTAAASPIPSVPAIIIDIKGWKL